MGHLKDKIIIYENKKTLSQNICIQEGNRRSVDPRYYYYYVHSSYINLGMLSIPMEVNSLGGVVLERREVS